MKTILLMIGVWLVSSLHLLAQSPTIYELKPGEIAIQVIPTHEQYLFPQFEPGSVAYRDGRSIPATLNYNILYGEIHFIDPKGDTLSLVDEYSLKIITIGESVFYHAYGVGYLEVVSNYSPVKLARKQNLEMVYNTTVSRDLYIKKAPGALQMTKKATYFLIDKNNRFYLARKPNLLKLFPRHKKAIDQYLKEQQTNFKLEKDLKNLLAFCSVLTKK